MRAKSRLQTTGAVLLTAALLAACAPDVQNTSGRDYMRARPELAATATTGETRERTDFRHRLRAAAEVEPRLRFPARIGLARIEDGRLTAIPPAEAEAWLKTSQRLGPRFGQFVPVSPLIAELVASEQGPARDRYYHGDVADTVRKLRLGAARQHVDAVLVYEVGGYANDSSTLLSVADLSIVGMFVVPSRHLKAEGFAGALLLDVRNGYPYGTANARADDQNLVPNAGSTAKTGDLLRDARTAAVVKLTGEVEKMAGELYLRRTMSPR